MTEQCPSASLSLHEVQAVLHIKSAPAIVISVLFELDSMYFVFFFLLVSFHYNINTLSSRQPLWDKCYCAHGLCFTLTFKSHYWFCSYWWWQATTPWYRTELAKWILVHLSQPSEPMNSSLNRWLWHLKQISSQSGFCDWNFAVLQLSGGGLPYIS